MKTARRHLVTAALPYANGPVHIGHLAGCYLPADIYVRYLRANKQNVKFICGSDEHGVPITIRAMKEGITPQQVVDKYHALIEESFRQMGVSFDIYHRTSAPLHCDTAQAFFKKLYDEGRFEEKESEQFYDEDQGMFLADRYITGECPVCHNPNAYGDQCEKCGSTLSPEQLINPHSSLSNKPLVKRTTKHWYFPLNQYEAFLKEWIGGKKDAWKPNVFGQCNSWLNDGLQPRAMTRDSSWGVPVPIEGANGKVLYVWFDAPIGYISATKALTPHWADYWQSEDTNLVHFIGKDNIVFHCIIFPAMLKAHGGFVLPRNVPANEFLNIEGEKVSTSRNWAVWVHEFLQDFPGQEDALRYVLCANAPETKDNDFTWKDFQNRVNSELNDNLGNFVNRAMVLMHKLCGGRVPKLHEALLEEAGRSLIREIESAKTTISTAVESFKFRDALAAIMALSTAGNKYLQVAEPWKLAKSLPPPPSEGGGEGGHPDAQKLIDNCIHLCLQLCANLAIYISPFLPGAARKLCHMLKVVDRMLDWENAGRLDLLKENYPLRAPEILFRKIEDAEIAAQVEKLHAGSNKQQAVSSEQSNPTKMEQQSNQQAEAKTASTSQQVDESTSQQASAPTIQFDDFAKIDLRAGTILNAVKVEKADKLLHLTVDLGEGQPRNIVSGIAQHFSPEEIIGRQVTVVANLAPRKMRGIESQGMILMAEGEGGKLVFVSPVEMVGAGSGVK